MNDMTPTEAADALEKWTDSDDPREPAEELRVLIDHARATAAPGDLAEVASGIEHARLFGETGSRTTPIDKGRLRSWTVALRAHRCPPAPEIAERPVEIVTGEQAAQLPHGSRFVLVRADDVPAHGATVCAPSDAGDYPRTSRFLVVYRPPEPPAPTIEIGQTLTTAAELDACPVGTVVRDSRLDRVVSERKNSTSDGWYCTGWDSPIDISLPARVLDVPTGGAA